MQFTCYNILFLEISTNHKYCLPYFSFCKQKEKSASILSILGRFQMRPKLTNSSKLKNIINFV